MDPAVFWQLVGLGLILVFTLFLGGWMLVRSLLGESTMQAAAKALGVEADGRSALKGELDGVSVQGQGGLRLGSRVRYAVDLALHDPYSLGVSSLRPRSVLTALGGRASAVEAELGIAVGGDLADVVSRLSPHARQALAAALEQGWVHGAGTWRLETSSQLLDAYWVEQAFRRGIELTKALRRSGTVADGLMARIQEEAPEALRVQAAELRLDVEPPLTGSERALLLEQGGEVGLRVAELLGDAATLRRALRAVEVAHRVRAAVALAGQGARDDEVRKVLRAALGTADEGLAVEALARVGTVEDVAVLRGAQGALGGAAIDDAVRAIQGRAVGAEAGQVSLADASGGGLGLAKDPRLPEGGGG